MKEEFNIYIQEKQIFLHAQQELFCSLIFDEAERNEIFAHFLFGRRSGSTTLFEILEGFINQSKIDRGLHAYLL